MFSILPGFLRNTTVGGGGGGGLALDGNGYPIAPAGTSRLAVWDVGAASTVSTSGGVFTGLADFYGNANATFALDGVATNGLTVVAGAGPNGTPAIVSSSASNQAVRTGGGNPGGWLTPAASAFTLLFVMKLGTAYSDPPIVIGQAGAGSKSLWSYFSSDGSVAKFYVTADQGSSVVGTDTSSVSISTTGLHKFVVRYNAGILDVFHNTDTKVTSTGNPGSLDLDRITLWVSLTGGRKDFSLFEMELYSGAFSDADCTGLIGYATTKHGTLA